MCVCEGVQAEPVLVPWPVPPPVPGLHHRGAGAPNIFKPRGCQVQRDQINMAVFFWYLVTCQLYANVHMYTGLWTIHFLQVNRKTRPCLTGHLVKEDISEPSEE